MSLSADQLLADAQAGDPAALGSLLTTHQDRLYRICLRMVNNRDDAAEVCQDVMMRIVEHVGEFRGQAQFTTWITRIAMNQALTFLRRRKLRRTVSLDAESPARGSGGNSGGDQASALRRQLAGPAEHDPALRVQTRERLQLLELALNRLEPDFRAVLVLRDIDGMDYQQIAESLDINLGTVKSRLFRARLALRQVMLKLERGSE
ncbi:MAG: RNA polymerase sigma factor [Phycisphaeraceae bacterium]|nr:RNA polymerase sigma factor [Phycisphaeraceae bacterium]